MRFNGIVQPEEFRTVTRAHVIAWRDDLIDGFDVLSLDAYQNVVELERRAAALGYPELA